MVSDAEAAVDNKVNTINTVKTDRVVFHINFLLLFILLPHFFGFDPGAPFIKNHRVNLFKNNKVN
jgi:hypothetical protein